ncbi:GGDEF domain-containing protein [Thalassotalea ganghwensis]
MFLNAYHYTIGQKSRLKLMPLVYIFFALIVSNSAMASSQDLKSFSPYWKITQGEVSGSDESNKGENKLSDDATPKKEITQELPIRPKVLSFVKLMENDQVFDRFYIEQLIENTPSLNAAEHLILNRLLAYLAEKEQKSEQVITLLNEAISYENQMADKQLNTPRFFDIYLKLSDHYALLEKFQLAYDSKATYMDRYQFWRASEKEKRMIALNEKYETSIKQKENQLLESQNELKQLKIKEAENKKTAEIRNIILLVCLFLIFVVLVMRQIKVRRKLHNLAKTDALTGLYNRRSLFEQGNYLVEYALKNKTSLSAILLDIDMFKSINDTFGHDAGDKVIKLIAQIGQETIRSRDYFARIGGEEYAAILPGTTLEEAKAFAERFREKVEQYDLSALDIARQVTVSIGVANLSQVDKHFDALLNAADEAMYHAKEQGRNRVCCYHEVNPE